MLHACTLSIYLSIEQPYLPILKILSIDTARNEFSSDRYKFDICRIPSILLENMTRSIYISGFHVKTRARDLALLMEEQVGRVKRIDIPYPKRSTNGGPVPPIAFAEFRDESLCWEAVKKLDNYAFEGHRLYVALSHGHRTGSRSPTRVGHDHRSYRRKEKDDPERGRRIVRKDERRSSRPNRLSRSSSKCRRPTRARTPVRSDNRQVERCAYNIHSHVLTALHWSETDGTICVR